MHFFVIMTIGEQSMDIIYKKGTLYVYLEEDMNARILRNLETRIERIMSAYGIENLVIDTLGENHEYMELFESRFNRRHRTKVIIK